MGTSSESWRMAVATSCPRVEARLEAELQLLGGDPGFEADTLVVVVPSGDTQLQHNHQAMKQEDERYPVVALPGAHEWDWLAVLRSERELSVDCRQALAADTRVSGQ